MNPEDVKVTLSGDTLMIQGEKRREDKREGDTWHVIERSYGSFQRSFSFPTAVDADSVEAESDNGVLCIKVMKAKEERPRRIEIRSGQRELQTTGKQLGASGGGAQSQEGGQQHGEQKQQHGAGGRQKKS